MMNSKWEYFLERKKNSLKYFISSFKKSNFFQEKIFILLLTMWKILLALKLFWLAKLFLSKLKKDLLSFFWKAVLWLLLKIQQTALGSSPCFISRTLATGMTFHLVSFKLLVYNNGKVYRLHPSALY